MKEIHSAVPTQAIDSGSLETHIATVMDEQRRFFYSNVTKDVPFRITQLKKLKSAIEQREKDLLNALKTDLNKHPFEGYGTEVGLVVKEIDNAIANLNNWTKPQKVGTPLFFFKANSYVQHEPYGSVLIIGPWNYPAQLIFLPLIAAIAAGNCVVVKPSEMAPATANVVSELISQTFDAAYVAVFEGNEKVAQHLLHHRFDLVFFTGSTAVGRLIYQAAAKHLTPVILELGGKSPCIVDKNVDLPLTAKRIVWGKLVNAGQTCIAPDYLLVHESVKEDLIVEMKKHIRQFFGSEVAKSQHYGRIVNVRHFDRLQRLLQSTDGQIVEGGEFRRTDLFISPTIVENVQPDEPLMEEEIFGPILPLLTYNRLEEAIRFIKDRPKPLALYVFSKDDKIIQRVLRETSSGGACVNDTLMQIGNLNYGFGGVGDSGMGSYHGKNGFEAFSHAKSIMNRSTMIDAPMRYPPYNMSVAMLKTLLKRLT